MDLSAESAAANAGDYSRQSSQYAQIGSGV